MDALLELKPRKGFGQNADTVSNQDKGLRQTSLEKTEQNAALLIRKNDFNACIQLWNDYYATTRQLSNDEINHMSQETALHGNQSEYLEAASKVCKILGSKRDHVHSLRNMAILLKRLGDPKNGMVFIDEYLVFKNDCPHGLNTKGTLYTDLGLHNEAICWYMKCLELYPDYPFAHSNLANEYHICAAIDKSVIHGSRAFYEKPDNTQITLDYLTYLKRSFDEESLKKINWWKVAERAMPDQLRNSFLQYLTLAETLEDQYRLKNVAKKWGDFYSNSTPSVKEEVIQKSDQKIHKINVGFVSPDFKDHSVARFIWPLFKYANQYNANLFCLSAVDQNDRWQEKFKQASSAFVDISQLSPNQIHSTVNELNINILFDLSGFTKGSKISLFGRRMAPIQVTWLGYPGTTGLNNMDYIFLDKYLNPEAKDLLHEKCLLTKGTSVCFSEMDEVPITDTLPEELRGYITFGSLNNSYKLNDNTIARWAKVMRHCKDSNFLFVRREFESYFLRRNVLNSFDKHGISPERIHFLNNRKVKRHYLDCYNEIDICLDTFPVTGGTTTVDSLWMGVPVITLEGPNIHQRVSSAIIRHANHPEWIAKSSDDFVKRSLILCDNQSKRREMRQTLRENLKQSLLCNEQEFVNNFFEALDSAFKEMHLNSA